MAVVVAPGTGPSTGDHRTGARECLTAVCAAPAGAVAPESAAMTARVAIGSSDRLIPAIFRPLDLDRDRAAARRPALAAASIMTEISLRILIELLLARWTAVSNGETMAAAPEPPATFAALLRQLRVGAGLTQEALAAAASLSSRAVSDLERGINLTARRDTARLLADALSLTGPARARFEEAARGDQAVTAGPIGTMATATRTLPRASAAFTGRDTELRQLLGSASTTGTGGEVNIHAVGGMAGIGKTTLAVHAAHLLAPSFPDGQIFLSLHAHTPGRRPVDPSDALASLLLTAGIAATQIRLSWRREAGYGAIIWPGSDYFCRWTTRPDMSKSGRCCPAPRASSFSSLAAGA